MKAIDCAGAGNADIANISNIYVACGLMRGVPRRVDGGPAAIFDDGSKWSSSLHACAATVGATIKTVTFSYNTTAGGIKGLSVTGIKQKEYSDAAQVPLWGVEDSGLTLDGISPIWGLIAEPYAEFPNISVVRQPTFYIPGLSGGPRLGYPGFQNLPGSDFPGRVMDQVFGDISSMPYDISGRGSMAIFLRWQELSKSARTAGSIINLLWTDLAASAVAGSKGVLGKGNAGLSNETISLKVRPIVNKIKYNYPFGIPAFILFVAILFITFLALFSALSKRSGIALLKKRLRQTAMGRILTTALDPGQSSLGMSSRE